MHLIFHILFAIEKNQEDNELVAKAGKKRYYEMAINFLTGLSESKDGILRSDLLISECV